MSPLWFVVAWHFTLRVLFPWAYTDKKDDE